MMEIIANYEIYLGTVAGSLLEYNQTDVKDKIIHFENETNPCEITSLSWGRTPHEILVGYKNGDITIYNTFLKKSKKISKYDTSSIVGAASFLDTILVATKKEIIHFSSPHNYKSIIRLYNVGEDNTLEKMISSPYDENIICMGGVNCDVRLYDIAQLECVFIGKSDRHDKLELAQPVSVQNIHIFNEGVNIGAVTREGQIRIYDIRKQRRPIIKHTDEKCVYTTISATSDDKRIVVGNNKGYLQLFDLRSHLKPVKTFKGIMGAVCDLVCDLETPIVASCSLDRYFRIHDLEEMTLKYQEYLKIQVTCMLMRRKHYIFAVPESNGAKKRKTSLI